MTANRGSIGPSETFALSLAFAEHSMEWKVDRRALTATVMDVYLLDWDGGPFQRWLFEVQDNGTYKIVQKATGRVLSSIIGRLCRRLPDNGSSSQRWQLRAEGDGHFALTNMGDRGRVLDLVPRAATAPRGW